ncbi:GNAT family N-acetyltransferase [Amycolatopsis cynarae]|uniref:GNAT family N-acetyltransferase n=1 Tax=Amycolatopsis cynarae TaxID=2995223 RepID=A0ABY7B5P5_9PSEU|nr:GNAT family N-acetyltransferase [Amycolatopsis sp. HUAS 11-8]WAL67661.1 GNAT family N-acetyltransferase [Amycolatopsis sp. HUAS 11-8]
MALSTPVIPAGRLAAHRQPRLTVDELILRPWRPGDSPRLVEAYRDEMIRRWHSRSMSEAGAAAWIAERSRRWTAETGADWAVVKDDDVPIGRIALHRLELARGAGKAAAWVVPEARGGRIAPRALDAITRWFFTEIGLHRIELTHSTVNTPPCQVAARAGYAYEGTKRREALHADGWHDMHLHARLDDD